MEMEDKCPTVQNSGHLVSLLFLSQRTQFGSVVLNLWVVTPFGGSNDPFTEVVYQIFCMSGTYTNIYNCSKIIVMK